MHACLILFVDALVAVCTDDFDDDEEFYSDSDESDYSSDSEGEEDSEEDENGEDQDDDDESSQIDGDSGTQDGRGLVQMRHGDKVLNFGCHKNEIEAALVYDKNARRIKGAKYAF